jgi:hypothetical protein
MASYPCYPKGPCSLGDKCRAPWGELRPRYRCAFCNEQLHAVVLGCGVSYDEDKVICPLGLGCATRKTSPGAGAAGGKSPATRTSKKSPLHHQQQPKRTGPNTPSYNYDHHLQQPLPTKKRSVPLDGKKRGIKIGTKLATKKTLEDWYHACHSYRNLADTMSQSSFLKSSLSGEKFAGTVSEQQSFGRFLRLYDADKLKPSTKRRCRDHRFKEVEAKLIEYLEMQQEEASWSLLQTKSLQIAQAMGFDDFVASPGWLSATLKDYQDKVARDNTADGETEAKLQQLPWDLITEDDYRNWLITVPCTETEFNNSTIVERAQLRNLYMSGRGGGT